MNWREFKKNVGARVRLRPLPVVRTGKLSKDWRDVDWIIQRIDEEAKQIELSAVGFGYAVILGKDHIHSFMSDTQRPPDGLKYGILKLHVRLIIDGVNIKLEPAQIRI